MKMAWRKLFLRAHNTLTGRHGRHNSGAQGRAKVRALSLSGLEKLFGAYHVVVQPASNINPDQREDSKLPIHALSMSNGFKTWVSKFASVAARRDNKTFQASEFNIHPSPPRCLQCHTTLVCYPYRAAYTPLNLLAQCVSVDLRPSCSFDEHSFTNI